MNLEAFLAAPINVQLHAGAALGAFALGAVQVFGPRLGRSAHRLLGWSWVTLMAVVAATAATIFQVNAPWPSFIHGFIVLTVVMLLAGLFAIRRGDRARHASRMRGLFVFGLLVPGAFTLIPGRLMYTIIFG